MYLGDYAEDYADLNFKFTTRDTDSTPTTLAGTPVVAVYKSNADGTEKTSGEAYITLSVDFDGVTGLNHVKIDLSGDAFFAVTEDYQVVITTGTVGGNSVVGEVVAHFSIENRFMRGTDSANTTVPDAATTAAGLHATTDGLIDAQNDFDPANDAVAVVTTVSNEVTADMTKISGGSTEADRLQAALGAGDYIDANLTRILGHLLTNTGTRLADGFENFFDVPLPTGTVNSLPEFAPDAAGGLPISDAGGLDMDGLDTKLDTAQTDLTAVKAVTDVSIYTASADLSIDAANSKDEYIVQWFKDGVPLTAGVTVPKIQVIKRADGTDLIANTAMTEIVGGSYRYDATTTERTTAGEGVVASVTATIDASTRTWRVPLSRDSTA